MSPALSSTMSPASAKPRVFSGIQPTGGLHLGNYLGALSLFAKLQQDYACIYCIVDLHALTAQPNPAALRRDTRAAAAAFLAAGIDAEKHILFNQARNPDHTDLAWLLTCLTPIGWLNRMTQFKEKAGSTRERAPAGLFVYPVLMAADILLYHATHVPIGEDQMQHLELAREIARRFNHLRGEGFFPEPQPVRQQAGARIMSLRDGRKKMSKSAASPADTIFIRDDADAIAQKIRRAKSDAQPVPETPPSPDARPEAANLIAMLAALHRDTPQSVCAQFAGQGWAAVKAALTERLVETLTPVGEEMKRLEADPAFLDKVLARGAARARALSAPILAETRERLGLLL